MPDIVGFRIFCSTTRLTITAQSVVFAERLAPPRVLIRQSFEIEIDVRLKTKPSVFFYSDFGRRTCFTLPTVFTTPSRVMY